MSKKAEVKEGEWNTEDLDKARLTGGKLPEEGVVIVPEEMTTKEGKNGEFRVVSGTDTDGKECDLVFSSSKLTKIFDAHWAEMKGRKVLVSGRGSGFERNYSVKLV
jgi:hypothetical protein